MPNVPETPNFEAIIQLLAITNNEAGFQLTFPVDTRRVITPNYSLISDAGIPQGVIQESQYSLVADSGIPQGVIQESQYQLVTQDVVNILSDVLSISDGIGNALLIDSLGLTIDDVRVFIDANVPSSVTPVNPPITPIKNQQTLLFDFIVVDCVYECRTKHRKTIDTD